MGWFQPVASGPADGAEMCHSSRKGGTGEEDVE